jgi:bifunctional DNA-binding transcriptional regulator/antitoxin component of YhaV-PrlF toxin-antitoxin module
LALWLTLAKVGKRGGLVIPSEERKKAQIDEGDRVEVQASGRGSLVVTKVPRIEDVRKRLSGKLPPWPELEGRADELVEKEVSD